MQVTVAIIPPRHVLDDVEAVLSRTPAPAGEFDRVARGALMIPVFSLGNVTRPDAVAVADLLRGGLDRSNPAPQVRLAGVWALESDGDPTIGLPLAGEVERLDDLTRDLWTLVASRGYFVDRRRWATRLTVGSVTETTSLPYLEQLVADLGGHTSAAWPVSSISFVRRRFDADDRQAWDLIDEVPTSDEDA